MKNVYEVLRLKELEVSRLKKEVEALRIAAPLLSEGEEGGRAQRLHPDLIVLDLSMPVMNGS
jgi:CheY-like chemotaxis protein